jgi:murein DD-endopeptidase MepM/ murein hydrolase activator NlpD
MSSGVALLRSHARVLVLTAIAGSAAGCSADSTRFGDGLFGSRPAPGEVTGSVAPGQAAPVGRVETTRLAAPGGVNEPMRLTDTGVAGGSRGLASYHPPGATPDVTGTVRKPPPPQWTWDGGTAVSVAQGESIDIIAQRHSVPASAILQANGLASPAVLYPGQRLVIPRNRQAAATPTTPAPRPPMIAAAKPASTLAPTLASATPAAAAPAATRAPTPAAAPAAQQGTHVIAQGDTLSKLSRRYHKSVDEIARANNIQPQDKLKLGDRLTIPGARAASAPPEAPKSAPKEVKDTPKDAKATIPGAKPNNQPATAPVESAVLVSPVVDTPAAGNGKTAPQAAAAPTFRWPVHGKVIAGFGPRPNGQQNDGINVAVPENTPVKAAEDGVVAYAGSELKGYGNLLLVRHSNGYVTAYAHAKELMVKRGDTVKRGQVIAKSGQTGAVDAPQLHFEVRKGPSPQDPMPMLNGG